MYTDTENQCVSKLNKALLIFNSLSADEKEEFMTSDEYVILTARARLLAWADNQGVDIIFSNGTYVVNKINSTLGLTKNLGSTLIFVVFLALGVGVICFSLKTRVKKINKNK
jgi:hypothetical protein